MRPTKFTANPPCQCLPFLLTNFPLLHSISLVPHNDDGYVFSVFYARYLMSELLDPVECRLGCYAVDYEEAVAFPTIAMLSILYVVKRKKRTVSIGPARQCIPLFITSQLATHGSNNFGRTLPCRIQYLNKTWLIVYHRMFPI